MPKYRFQCDSCSDVAEKIVPISRTSSICSICGMTSSRLLPSAGSQKVLEVVDSFTNVKHTTDQEEELKARKTEYFWEVEVPRLVQTYSIETCLEEGWLVYNDKKELVINKPPSKR